eukprot:895959-Alexandrium_andersonii.AAC.1
MVARSDSATPRPVGLAMGGAPQHGPVGPHACCFTGPCFPPGSGRGLEGRSSGRHPAPPRALSLTW